ncbi:MAG: mechanosensitive ion channel protein MscS [Citromicrobium sp.]|nr:mechanosensitive ion channel protein MscS [Citromicrobium sp.]MAS85783.1 mechanosensitive ion channel protein MscS [Erythrobacteraceae bacterium]MBD75470.1 mechanosensitive ion channel protein MscS [Citromicrobium sp.]MBT47137.1 mechanosensitive ion channel protein MscS [Citromicrobium sp.]|tara:strand:- start:2620 stop:3543 length:924 start_codon:yes stop_codon:yes gene_type:complete
MTTPTTTPSDETYDQTVDTLATLQDQLVDMAEGFVRALPNMAIALVIIVITWIVARIAVRGVSRAIGKTDMRPSLQNLIDTVVKLGIWIVGLMIALIVVMPGMTPASLIAGLGIGAVAIGFAFQDIFENFLAGVLIMLREKMRIGDVIECEGIIGKVEHITLRETHVRKLSGEVTLVPNSMLFKNPVEILTDEQMRRHEVIAGVSYDTDLDHAAEVIRKAVESVDVVERDKGIDVFAVEFNSSSVDFKVRWWAGSTPRNMWESKDKVIRAIKRALDDAGIEIPFPYITHTFKECVPLGRDPGEAVEG